MNILLATSFAVATMQYDLPAGLLESLCFVESGHHIESVHNHDGKTASYGICQVKLETAGWLGFKGTAKDLMEPTINIQYAAKYLHYNLKRYHGNIHRALIGYNRGHASDLITTQYSIKVVALMEQKY